MFGFRLACLLAQYLDGAIRTPEHPGAAVLYCPADGSVKATAADSRNGGKGATATVTLLQCAVGQVIRAPFHLIIVSRPPTAACLDAARRAGVKTIIHFDGTGEHPYDTDDVKAPPLLALPGPAITHDERIEAWMRDCLAVLRRRHHDFLMKFANVPAVERYPERIQDVILDCRTTLEVRAAPALAPPPRRPETPLNITPSQALLLMMDAAPDDGALCRAYFDGLTGAPQLEGFLAKYGAALEAMSLQTIYRGDQLSDSKEQGAARLQDFINEDATRRYFETHLAFHTLLNHLDSLPADLLNDLYRTARELGGDTKTGHAESLARGEYFELGEKGITSTGTALSAAQIAKSKMLCKIAAIAVDLAKAKVSMPLDIYEESELFADGFRGRMPRAARPAAGGADTKDERPVASRKLGILRFDTPLPRYDIARSAAAATYQRPADNSNPRVDGGYPKRLQAALVLPFSNSPSGTMLCQLRLLTALRRLPDNKDGAAARWTLYFRCFTAAMLYGSGGHTIHEFLVPFEDAKVRSGTGLATITPMSVFFDGNKVALMAALAATKSYTLKFIALKRHLKAGFVLPRIERIRRKLADEKKAAEEKLERERQAAVAARAEVMAGTPHRLDFTRKKEALRKTETKSAASDLAILASIEPLLATQLAQTHRGASKSAIAQALLAAIGEARPRAKVLLMDCLSPV
ncbi:MAG: hypothetical protein QM820_44335 [Minicystis sp.]